MSSAHLRTSYAQTAGCRILRQALTRAPDIHVTSLQVNSLLTRLPQYRELVQGRGGAPFARLRTCYAR